MVTTKELEHLAVLARIQLTDEDKVSLVKEFDSILGYIDQLKKVDVDIDGSSRVGSVKNVMREDVASSDLTYGSVDSSTTNNETRERLLDEAPDREGDFVAVKKIIAQDIKL